MSDQQLDPQAMQVKPLIAAAGAALAALPLAALAHPPAAGAC